MVNVLLYIYKDILANVALPMAPFLARGEPAFHGNTKTQITRQKYKRSKEKRQRPREKWKTVEGKGTKEP